MYISITDKQPCDVLIDRRGNSRKIGNAFKSSGRATGRSRFNDLTILGSFGILGSFCVHCILRIASTALCAASKITDPSREFVRGRPRNRFDTMCCATTVRRGVRLSERGALWVRPDEVAVGGREVWSGQILGSIFEKKGGRLRRCLFYVSGPFG